MTYISLCHWSMKNLRRENKCSIYMKPSKLIENARWRCPNSFRHHIDPGLPLYIWNQTVYEAKGQAEVAQLVWGKNWSGFLCSVRPSLLQDSFNRETKEEILFINTHARWDTPNVQNNKLCMNKGKYTLYGNHTHTHTQCLIYIQRSYSLWIGKEHKKEQMTGATYKPVKWVTNKTKHLAL